MKQGLRFSGDALRCVAMPLGGLGTGNLAICGDGSLRQWQLHNRPNHVGYIPYSFFGVFWKSPSASGAQLLQSKRFWNEPDFTTPPTSSDHYVPDELKKWAQHLPATEVNKFEGAYPVGKLEYDLGDAPVKAELKAWSPFVPHNSNDSGWPVAVFDFSFTNTSDKKVFVKLLSCLQNAVGWDAQSIIHGVSNGGYGGNYNHKERFGNADGALLTNTLLPENHPSQGAMALVGIEGKVAIEPQWSDLDTLWNEFERRGFLSESQMGASEQGKTWNAAMTQTIELEPGQSKTLTVIMGWHFPNRYSDFLDYFPGTTDDMMKSRFFIGNQYANRGPLREWMSEFVNHIEELRLATEQYASTICDPSLPEPLISASTSNVANLRTNVCLWTKDGRFHGFEGGHGASTWEGFHGSGGCCPMNCTHVWNYDQTLLTLWPDLFRTMRETDWKINQKPSGDLPHRTPLPLYLPRLWANIGGPENPALDGLFAGVLKTYQYYLSTGDRDWLLSVWEHVKRGMTNVLEHHDTDKDGVLKGEQPNTYDIHLFGPNTFIGSQYMAALRATEQMAKIAGEEEFAAICADRAAKGKENYSKSCFNGEYYVQRVPEDCKEPYQFGLGCCSDHLLGQWWAHLMGLGYVLPEHEVKSSVKAIFKRNFRTSFAGFKQEPRVFASDHNHGLLNATYEEGQRPEVPLLYSDEVWPGVEYAFAQLCFFEGMIEEGMKVVTAVRGRYDGTERNPFNEIECGDHYVRSLCAWGLLQAYLGCRYDAGSKTLFISPRPNAIGVMHIGKAAVRVTHSERVTIELLSGEIELETVAGEGCTIRGDGLPRLLKQKDKLELTVL